MYSSEDELLDIAGGAAFAWNAATGLGGAIGAVGPLSLSVAGATFTSNRAFDGAGAIWVDSDRDDVRYVLENSTFVNNSVTSDGGALFLSIPSGQTDIRGATFVSNFAGADGVSWFCPIFMTLVMYMAHH